MRQMTIARFPDRFQWHRKCSQYLHNLAMIFKTSCFCKVRGLDDELVDFSDFPIGIFGHFITVSSSGGSNGNVISFGTRVPNFKNICGQDFYP